MNLTRPIVFMDIEATGADATRDRIVEIALIKMQPDRSTENYVQRVNPGMRIPTEVIAVHHITNEDIAQAPSFKQIAPQVVEFCTGCDFAGFGIARFDIPMLKEEFRRCDIAFDVENRCILDGLTIYHQKERRDLTAAYEFYCRKTLVGAHGALADAQASQEVLLAQLERYTDLPKDLEGLHTFCNKQDDRFVDSTRKLIWRDGEAALNFGKYKGELLKTLVTKQRDYIEWIVSDGKFQQDIVDICWRALRGQFPKNGKKANGAEA
jgi:DNA polymerase-3 subunit epsilon